MGCESFKCDYVLLQGLEKEYDRLLEENDDLKRRLSRHDSSATYQASNKRDWTAASENVKSQAHRHSNNSFLQNRKVCLRWICWGRVNLNIYGNKLDHILITGVEPRVYAFQWSMEGIRRRKLIKCHTFSTFTLILQRGDNPVLLFETATVTQYVYCTGHKLHTSMVSHRQPLLLKTQLEKFEKFRVKMCFKRFKIDMDSRLPCTSPAWENWRQSSWWWRTNTPYLRL